MNLKNNGKNKISSDIALNRFSGLCPRMTNEIMDTRVKPEYDKKKISSLNPYPLSSLVIGQENVHLLSCSNLSHLSSSDLIGGSIKDKGSINILSQTNKGDIPSNNLLQQKEYDTNSNNLSQRKGYTMNPTILPQQNDFNTNPNNLPQQKEYNSNNLPKKKGYNMKQPNLSQSGRSMVEMLGVLAIIGVLSVGGIMGYSYGMDKWRANETVNDINLRHVDVLTQYNQMGGANLDNWKNEETLYPITLESGTIGIQVDNVPKRPCEFIFKELTHSATIKINGSEYNSKTSDDICGNKNSMVFYFDECAGVACDICQKCDYETQTCITLPSNRERCKTDAGTGWCVNGACKIDPCNDCSDTQFCADKNDNKWSANPFECKELNFKTVILDFNGKKETWLMSLEKMSWWDAKTACAKMGKNIPSAHEFIKDWDEQDRYYPSFNEHGKKLFDLIKNDMPNDNVWVQERRGSALSYVVQSNGTVVGSLVDGTYAGTVLCR